MTFALISIQASPVRTSSNADSIAIEIARQDGLLQEYCNGNQYFVGARPDGRLLHFVLSLDAVLTSVFSLWGSSGFDHSIPASMDARKEPITVCVF
jgi:hypothetical protein